MESYVQLLTCLELQQRRLRRGRKADQTAAPAMRPPSGPAR